MKYAAALTDGSVSIIDPAPESVVVKDQEFRVSHSERSEGSGFRVTYYDPDDQQPHTIPFNRYGKSPNATLKFHAPEAIAQKLGKDVTEIVPVTDETILQDRTFRDALTMVNSVLATDMVKARNIHREHIRAARKPKLDQADVDYFKALEAAVVTGLSPETAEYIALESIATIKQQLRDAPQDPAIEAAQTPEELKAIWPDVLK